MNIFILSNQLTSGSGCNYYRAEVPGKYLFTKLGHRVVITNSIPAARAKKWAFDEKGIYREIEYQGLDEKELLKFDVFVFQRYYMDHPAALIGLVQWAKANNRKVIYEVDDNMHEIPQDNPCYEQVMAPSTQKLIDFFLREANVVTCASSALKSKYNGVLLPNCLDWEVWDQVLQIKPHKSEKVRIGFAGGASHMKDLQMIAPVLKKLEARGDVEIVILGIDPKFDFPYKFQPFIPVYRHPFKLRKLGFDIGICPLTDDPFNDYKSNIKWVEYSALSIPTVASNRRPYFGIKNNTTGYLCDTLEQWEENLTTLIENPKLRNRIGRQAYTWTRKRYDIAENVQQWVKAYS